MEDGLKPSSRLTDMTVGGSLGHILRFTVPLLWGNLFQQLYNLVDSVVVGKYVGKDALAAVGICGPINSLFFALGFGLGGGIGIIVAQYLGANDIKNVRTSIANSYTILGSVAIIVSIISLNIAEPMLLLMGTPEAIFADTLSYLRITILGFLGIAIYNGVTANLRALGDAKTPLYFLIFCCIVNAVMDLFFILVLGMGVEGAGIATIISQFLSAIISTVYAVKRVDYFKNTREEFIPNKRIVLRSFSLGIPLTLQSAMISISCVFLQGIINLFGENVIAACTITSRIESLVSLPLVSLGTAITNFSGQNIGAKKTDRVRKGLYQSLIIVIVFCSAMLPLMYFFGRDFAGFFVNEDAVKDIVQEALRITCFFYYPLGIIVVLRSLLNGCGDGAFALINGLTELVGRVVFSCAFVHFGLFGYLCIWVTTGLTWALTALSCIIRYVQGKWKMV